MTDHGYSAYTHGCRCDICREAKATYMRELRAEARKYAGPSVNARGRYVANIPTHGIYGYQTHQCRCDECVAAHSAAQRRQYHARVRRQESA